MSVKITWLNIACSIFGLSQRHILSTAMMEDIDRDEHNLSPTFVPARLAMNAAVADDSTNDLGDVFVSEFHANWGTPSLNEAPPQSKASAVCAWLSTLHLIVGRYSAPCSVYLTTPISLVVKKFNLVLPGAIYVDSLADFPEPSMYVLVPVASKDLVLRQHRSGKLDLVVGGHGGKCGFWYSVSAEVFRLSNDLSTANASLAAPFGYNLIVRKSQLEKTNEEGILEADITFHDPSGEKVLEKWLHRAKQVG